MSLAFDTLGYSKRLRDAGVAQQQADAQAEAARDYIMAELVTKSDLAAAVDGLRATIEAQSLKQTIRTGTLMAALVSLAVGVIALLIG